MKQGSSKAEDRPEVQNRPVDPKISVLQLHKTKTSVPYKILSKNEGSNAFEKGSGLQSFLNKLEVFDKHANQNGQYQHKERTFGSDYEDFVVVNKSDEKSHELAYSSSENPINRSVHPSQDAMKFIDDIKP